MFDKEIEAIAKCSELIKDLETDAKMRVIKYLIERFGIGGNPSSLNNIPIQQSNNHDYTLESNQSTPFVEVVKDEYPSLKQLMIKNYPKNETEWILCYAFFASQHGEETFKKENILEKYRENNRLNPSNSGNVTNNLNACIKKDWMKDINKDEFVLKPEGVVYAKEILKGNSVAKEVKRTKKVKLTTEITE